MWSGGGFAGFECRGELDGFVGARRMDRSRADLHEECGTERFGGYRASGAGAGGVDAKTPEKIFSPSPDRTADQRPGTRIQYLSWSTPFAHTNAPLRIRPPGHGGASPVDTPSAGDATWPV
ncbi:hypothetical protein [Nocardia stercoris]|uniref:hypothetical protein n=1 Tax=Nocardia stercoris TaxID=2483361 RepID=UPI001319C49F|nr:hypothetical protein [Nocardia stercoris]